MAVKTVYSGELIIAESILSKILTVLSIFCDIGTFDVIRTGGILAKNREIALIFFGNLGDIRPLLYSVFFQIKMRRTGKIMKINITYRKLFKNISRLT